MNNVPNQWSPTFLAPRTSFMEGNFSTDQGNGGGVGNGFRMIQALIVLVHFISIVITSAPRQIIRH